MRRLLTIALGAFVLVATGAGADPPGQANAPSIDGTWFTSLTYYYEGKKDGSSENLQYLTQFTRDGRAVIYLPQVAGQRFDETRTACAGEWRRRGGQTFDVTLYCVWREIWGDVPETPDRILIKVTLARDGKSFTATPFYYQTWANGEYSGAPGWGAMNGVRLGLVPIP
jgi:hypothetical protein